MAERPIPASSLFEDGILIREQVVGPDDPVVLASRWEAEATLAFAESWLGREAQHETRPAPADHDASDVEYDPDFPDPSLANRIMALVF